MDCEKFEPLLLDELYEELDELTSAAVKRHVSGCARCASILDGMRATREAAAIPLEPLPDGLEERILAATKEAQKVVPLRPGLSRILSVAGSWAMRPQTAMAAVFLLMVGTSAFLIRSKDARMSAPVSVTVAGEPASPSPVAQSEALDDRAAAAAHGPTPPSVARPAAAAPSAVAMADRAEERTKGGGGRALLDDELFEKSASAPAATATALAANAMPPPSPEESPGSQASRSAGPQQDAFSLGAAAFRARNYAEATRQFDLAAQSGDPNAALWAAESTREGNGCVAALGRYDRLAQRASGSWVGDEAALRAARCEIEMRRFDPARTRLTRLAQGGTHQQAARDALAELDQAVAQGHGGGGGASAGAVAKPRMAAPPAKAASPVRAPEQSEQKAPVDMKRDEAN